MLDRQEVTISIHVPSTIRVLMPSGQVTEMPLEAYLPGAVAVEMNANAPLEALKAQAVASRTYAASVRRHADTGADICTTLHCQEWKRVDPAVAPQVFRAVRETSDIVVVHNGKLIDAYFFEHCDGHTRNAEDLMLAPSPYLRGVACECGFDSMQGHGIGLCQRGAIVMARRGAAFEQILQHYYQGAVLFHAKHGRLQSSKPPSPDAKPPARATAIPVSKPPPVKPISRRMERPLPPKAGPVGRPAKPPTPMPVRPDSKEAKPIGSVPRAAASPVEPPAQVKPSIPETTAPLAKQVIKPSVPSTREGPLAKLPATENSSTESSSSPQKAADETKRLEESRHLEQTRFLQEIGFVPPIENKTTAAETQVTEGAPVLPPPAEPVAAPSDESQVGDAQKQETILGLGLKGVEALAGLVDQYSTKPAKASTPETPTTSVASAPVVPVSPPASSENPVPPGEQRSEPTVQTEVASEHAEPQPDPGKRLPEPVAPLVEPLASTPNTIHAAEKRTDSEPMDGLRRGDQPAMGPAEERGGASTQDAVTPPTIPCEEIPTPKKRVHIDHLPGGRIIAGSLPSAGQKVTIRGERGPETTVSSGSAPHYGVGGFEILVGGDGRYFVEIADQLLEVQVKGDTVFIHWDEDF